MICLLDFLCEPLKNEIIEKIKTDNKDNTRAIDKKIKEYHNLFQDIKTSLNDNNRYEDCCDFYKKICSDINTFIAATY